jgi:hypothetical protein
MKFIRLNGTDEEPFCVDMTSYPNCNGLLYYLEKSLGIKVLEKSAWFLSGDYFAKFEFKGNIFEITTPLSSPLLSAKKGCPEKVFAELLSGVEAYSFLNPTQGFIGYFRYLGLNKYLHKRG